jgi:hypothetical protein
MAMMLSPQQLVWREPIMGVEYWIPQKLVKPQQRHLIDCLI